MATPPAGHRSWGRDRASSDVPRAEEAVERHHSVHLVPVPASTADDDNRFFSASTSLSPLLTSSLENEEGTRLEMKSETVGCEVPVRVLAGNTAFVVRPSVYQI